MSYLKYYAYNGVGARNKQRFKQMEPGTREFYMEINAEINQAFQN
ncbi:hypothetical protein FOYG_14120 [Fusarium oxysporum NRRL 32931]|uniref:Uncharacterized protein n=1 Tax=Fusarium oxysporum NRRL 32931 TaxID=660029 RepID=W9HM87_FUSOX|nr:hypothetical protein FOYG_14120 [Fusarium oxysporum NRRL 32931]